MDSDFRDGFVGFGHEQRESMYTVFLFCWVQIVSIVVAIFTACPMLLSKLTLPGHSISSSGIEVTYFWQIFFYGQEFSWYTEIFYPVDFMLQSQ
jgi:hypothetical protein